MGMCSAVRRAASAASRVAICKSAVRFASLRVNHTTASVNITVTAAALRCNQSPKTKAISVIQAQNSANLALRPGHLEGPEYYNKRAPAEASALDRLGWLAHITPDTLPPTHRAAWRSCLATLYRVYFGGQSGNNGVFL